MSHINKGLGVGAPCEVGALLKKSCMMCNIHASPLFCVI